MTTGMPVARRARAAHLTWSARGAITLGEETNARIEIVDVSSADDAGDANAIERVDFVLAHGTEATEQSGPSHPASQWQMPSGEDSFLPMKHRPWPEQLLGQW